MDLHRKTWHIPGTLWSEKLLETLNDFDVPALFAQDCVMYRVTSKPSTIIYLSVRMPCYATRILGKGEPMEHYYGTIILRANSEGPPERSYEKKSKADNRRTLKHGLFTSGRM